MATTKTPTATILTSILTTPISGTTTQKRTASPTSTVFIPHNVTPAPTSINNSSMSRSYTTSGSSYITAVPGASKQENVNEKILFSKRDRINLMCVDDFSVHAVFS